MQCHVDKYVIVSNGNEYDTYTAYHVVQIDEGGIEEWDVLGEPCNYGDAVARIEESRWTSDSRDDQDD